MGFTLYIATLMFLLVNCAPQLTGGKTKSEKANGGKVETVGEEQLDIVTKDGTAVTIPPGALAVGSQVTVQPTAQPEEFAATSEAGIAAASSPLEFTANGPDGLPVSSVATPMTINIPLANVGANLALQNTNEQLCTLLKSSAGELFVWRRSSITVDEAAAAVIIKTLHFGVFQLVYCGTTELPGFKDAADQGLTGELKYSLSLIVPANSPAYSAQRHCLVLVESLESDVINVIAATSKDVTEAADTVLSLAIVESKIADGKSYYLAVTFQSADVECPYTAGSPLPDQDLGFAGNIIFPISANTIIAGVEATLGAGDYALESVDIAIGAPGDIATFETALTSVACIEVENVDTGGIGELAATISADFNINGAQTATVYLPAGSTSNRVRATVGAHCGSSGIQDLATGRPFTADLSGFTTADTVYLVPVQMTISSLFGSIPSNACISAWSDAQGDSGKRTQFLIKLSAGLSFDILLPYAATAGLFNLADGQPVYDMAIDAVTDDCSTKTVPSTGIPPGVSTTATLADQPLNGSITIPEEQSVTVP